MKVRKAVFVLMLFALCLLGGCVQKNQQTEEEAEETPLIGISIYRYDDGFMKLYRDELEKYLQETYQARIVMRSARNSRLEQKEQVREFVSQGCDGVIVNLVSEDDGKVITEVCRKAGVPVVFVNRVPSAEETERWQEEKIQASSVSADFSQAAILQGEIILDTPNQGDINGDGIVSCAFLMGEDNGKNSRQEIQYSVKTLEEAGLQTEVLYSGYGSWERQRGKELAKKAVEAGEGRLEVIFCGNDTLALGAEEALEEAGIRPGQDIYLTGADGLQEAVNAVSEGRLTGTVWNDYTSQSHLAADVLMNLIDGKKEEVFYQVDYVKISMADALEKNTDKERSR